LFPFGVYFNQRRKPSMKVSVSPVRLAVMIPRSSRVAPQEVLACLRMFSRTIFRREGRKSLSWILFIGFGHKKTPGQYNWPGVVGFWEDD